MGFIVGTAGHIDHGKTSLVKALTGQDTDRLKEEKERGISIELGFAHLDLPDGRRAGVVDVPGHERFIRTMLAGAHGMNLVLFTVAADDGVMPQTVEHLDILHLLGVTNAIFVITKTDLATPARVAEVETQIQRLIAGTALEGSAMVRYSFVTREGLETLRAELSKSLERIDTARPQGYFRLPVDRVFVLQGHGLIVTGTALQGEIASGDRVRRLPGGELLRIRSMQVHGQPVSRASAGQRVALNLVGPQKISVERGDVLCDEKLTMVSERCDVSLEVRPAAAGIKNHQRVRIHIGTAERLGKIVVLDSHDTVPAGRRAFCQLVLATPLQVVRGDRFIIRDETAQRTLGGGFVIHPWSRVHVRHEPGLDAGLQILRAGNLSAVTELFLDEREELATAGATVQEFLNLRAADALARLREIAAVKVVSLDGDDFFTTERKWNALKATLVSALREFHSACPLEQGRDMEVLREKLRPAVTPKMFRAFVESLEMEGVIRRQGSLLRLPDHRVSLRQDEQEVASRIRQLLARHPLMPPDLPQLAREMGIDRARLGQLIRVLERERSVVRVAADLYFLCDAVDLVVRTLREEWAERDEITPAMFRDKFNTTRKYAIPLLEYLDGAGVTMRIGDRRRLRGARL